MALLPKGPAASPLAASASAGQPGRADVLRGGVRPRAQAHTNPGYLRRAVGKRDRGVCAVCRTDTRALGRALAALDAAARRARMEPSGSAPTRAAPSPGCGTRTHVRPVAEGAGSAVWTGCRRSASSATSAGGTSACGRPAARVMVGPWPNLRRVPRSPCGPRGRLTSREALPMRAAALRPPSPASASGVRRRAGSRGAKLRPRKAALRRVRDVRPRRGGRPAVRESPPAPGTVKRDAPKPRSPAAPRPPPSCDAARCGNPVRPPGSSPKTSAGSVCGAGETVRRRVERGRPRAVIRTSGPPGANVEPCALGCGARARLPSPDTPRLADSVAITGTAPIRSRSSGCSPEAAVDRLRPRRSRAGVRSRVARRKRDDDRPATRWVASRAPRGTRTRKNERRSRRSRPRDPPLQLRRPVVVGGRRTPRRQAHPPAA